MSSCKGCTVNTKEEKKPEAIPYIVHEAVVDREARRATRWMVAFFAALALVFITGTGWIVSESRREEPSLVVDSAFEDKAQG